MSHFDWSDLSVAGYNFDGLMFVTFNACNQMENLKNYITVMLPNVLRSRACLCVCVCLLEWYVLLRVCFIRMVSDLQLHLSYLFHGFRKKRLRK